MELTQVQNSQQLNVINLDSLRSQKVENTDLQQTQIKNSVDKIEDTHSTLSSFGLNLSSSISSISNIQIAKNEVSTALKLVNSFEKVVTGNRNNLDSVQPEIQSFINIFNTSAKGLSDNLSKIVEEKQNGDSRIYFDGILGSKPISGQEIYEAISKQKENLEQYNKALNSKLEAATTQAKEMFSNEKANTPSLQQVDQKVDFEVESVTFEATTVQSQKGSMIQTQANAEPQASTELLAAS